MPPPTFRFAFGVGDCIRHCRPWRGPDDVECGMLGYIDRYTSGWVPDR